MKDISAILLNYSDQIILHKALTSLKNISPRLQTVIVLQENKNPLHTNKSNFLDHIQYITIGGNNLGKALNNTIRGISSKYVLFLQNTDYLTPTMHIESLELPPAKTVLEQIYQNKNITIHVPLLVRTSFLKKKPFLSNLQLPFKEALFSAWLSDVDDSFKTFKDNLVRQARKNYSVNTREKQKFIRKYQLKKIKTNSPSLSILISNYNMEKYVETAIVSCLLQNEMPEQLLIIDDGSTDNSYKQIKSWHDGDRVQVYHKQNEGKAKALNYLLPHVTSDFILELDADDWLDPDAISVIKEQLANLPEDVAVLYGNLRKWKQLSENVLFKRIAKGHTIKGSDDLLSYRLPLGPRIYRTSLLKHENGFPVIAFANGRLYEDVSLLNRLIKKYRFWYQDFTIYNVREHKESITKNNLTNWNDFLKTLK